MRRARVGCAHSVATAVACYVLLYDYYLFLRPRKSGPEARVGGMNTHTQEQDGRTRGRLAVARAVESIVDERVRAQCRAAVFVPFNFVVIILVNDT